MPRKLQLTWQSGTADRPGRWRKKFRRKSYYFPGGRGKSDRAAYDQAVTQWEQLKAKLMATAPKPNQAQYETVIGQWEEVLACARECGELEMEATALEKLAALRQRLAAARPRKITRADTLDGYLDTYQPRFGYAAMQEQILQVIDEGSEKWEIQISGSQCVPQTSVGEGDAGLWDAVTSRPTPIENDDGIPGRVPMVAPDLPDSVSQETKRGIWRDRLKSRRRNAVPDDQTIKTFVGKFLAEKEADATTGELSTFRAETLRVNLQHFMDWLGHGRHVKQITSQVLVDYRTKLLSEAQAKALSSDWAHSRLSSLKTFVRWLWHMEAIESLPRMLDSPALNISRITPPVITYTTEEIKLILQQASDRTKLFVLLMLNCGMTQKDISDLLRSEVDWEQGRIIRKRSKTKKKRNAPVVNYLLWAETLALLRQEQSEGDDSRVVLNKNGQPLWQESRGSDGKFKKMDNIRNAFERLRKKTGIAKTLKSFKKTSATLIRGHGTFSSLERVFLGHAATTMSDKHYTQLPQDLLDEAIRWLRDELGISESSSEDQMR